MLVPVALGVATTVAATLVAPTVRNIAQTHRLVTTSNREANPLLGDISLPLANKYQLQTMTRGELLELYLQCEAPQELDDIEGEWDGCLLENNSLTLVTTFITNVIFGRGRKWKGKTFYSDGTGVNRFCGGDESGLKVETVHSFDQNLGESRLAPSSSVILDYSPYQSPLSLWYTMKDELRVVPVETTNMEIKLMIGYGWMTWSGGHLNGSPFCLWKILET